MRFRGMKLNKKEITDVVIGALAVKNAPKVLSFVLPASMTTGMTGNVAGGLFAYVLGMLLKKPTVSNVGVALAVTNLVQDVAITPALQMVAPGGSSTVAANTRRLREYAASPRSASNYAFVYANN